MGDGLARLGNIALLDEDPDLAVGLEPDRLLAARRRAVARVIEVEPPGWDVSVLDDSAEAGWLGLFILSGVLLRRVQVGRRSACELLGPGDLIRPWDTDGNYDPLPTTVDWLALRTTRLAVLDHHFVLRIAPWPVISGRIVARIAQRARYLALTQAVTHLPRASDRLLVLFWLLAERWGKVTPEGVSLTLPVTHEVLSMLVGARRPTVTLALQRLSQADQLIREGRHRWLLTNRAIECLSQPESLSSIEPAVAEHSEAHL
jgi:CRP-like cAMP-binding protein